jgi:hypothetical protein
MTRLRLLHFHIAYGMHLDIAALSALTQLHTLHASHAMVELSESSPPPPQLTALDIGQCRPATALHILSTLNRQLRTLYINVLELAKDADGGYAPDCVAERIAECREGTRAICQTLVDLCTELTHLKLGWIESYCVSDDFNLWTILRALPSLRVIEHDCRIPMSPPPPTSGCMLDTVSICDTPTRVCTLLRAAPRLRNLQWSAPKHLTGDANPFQEIENDEQDHDIQALSALSQDWRHSCLTHLDMLDFDFGDDGVSVLDLLILITGRRTVPDDVKSVAPFPIIPFAPLVPPASSIISTETAVTETTVTETAATETAATETASAEWSSVFPALTHLTVRECRIDAMSCQLPTSILKLSLIGCVYLSSAHGMSGGREWPRSRTLQHLEIDADGPPKRRAFALRELAERFPALTELHLQSIEPFCASAEAPFVGLATRVRKLAFLRVLTLTCAEEDIPPDVNYYIALGRDIPQLQCLRLASGIWSCEICGKLPQHPVRSWRDLQYDVQISLDLRSKHVHPPCICTCSVYDVAARLTP